MISKGESVAGAIDKFDKARAPYGIYNPDLRKLLYENYDKVENAPQPHLLQPPYVEQR